MIRKIQTIISKLAKAQSREDDAAANADEWSSMEQKIKAIMASVFKIDINPSATENHPEESNGPVAVHQYEAAFALPNSLNLSPFSSNLVPLSSI